MADQFVETHMGGEDPQVPFEDHPPTPHLPPGEWVKKNLFNSTLNSVITIVFGLIVLWVGWFAITWLIDADFTIIRDTLRVFMIGSFPDDELWRLWIQGYLLMFAIGFASGARARTSFEQAKLQGVGVEPQSLLGLLRRFWPIILALVVFASFAKTISPMILVFTSVATAIVARYVGWAAPAAVRLRSGFIAALLVIASMLVVAGTSKFGGAVVGLVLFFWAFTEFRRGDPSTSAGQEAVRWIVPLVIGLAAYFVIASIGFEGYGWKDWGGLYVNVFTAVIGIVLGLPLGILLALGRRSELPVVKTASVLFIEFVRGVPLLSLLIFSIVFLPFFLPPSWETPAALTLAIVVIAGFSAAYIAEIVRGGLQAVAKGQTEAAQALGLAPGPMQRFIVLPQALRAVIPAMVGQFISLFKDTSLLFAAGVLEFLGASTIANNQPQFLGRGLAPVTLLFVAFGFWAFSYNMSRESRLLEKRLDTSR